MDGTDQAIVTAKYTSSNHYFKKKIKKTIFKLSWTWKSYDRYGFEIGLWPLPKRTCFMMALCLARKIHMNIPEASINRALKHVFVSVSSFDKKKVWHALWPRTNVIGQKVRYWWRSYEVLKQISTWGFSASNQIRVHVLCQFKGDQEHRS